MVEGFKMPIEETNDAYRFSLGAMNAAPGAAATRME